MHKIDGIIFDMDGTLWDAVPAIYQAWKDELKEQGYDYSFTLEEMKSLFGEQVDTFGDVLFSDLPQEKARRLAHDCCDHQVARMRENKLLYPYTGVVETLKLLATKYPLFIVTNAEDGYAQCFMDFTDTASCFTDFQHADASGRSKADNISLLMKRNHLENVVYVGDTAGDQAPCQSIGVPFIWCSYGFGQNVENSPAIHHFDELPDCLNHFLDQ